VTFQESRQTFLTGYFATCRRSAKTRAAYEIDLTQLQVHVGPDGELSAVTSEKMEEWAQNLRAAAYASVSVRRKFATARVFFTFWVRRKVIEKSPLWGIRLDLGREKLLPRALTSEAATKFIEQMWQGFEVTQKAVSGPNDPVFLRLRNLAAFEILFATGMRVGELVGLKLQDWCESEVSFTVNGKGSRQRLAFLPDDRSLKALRAYLVQRKSLSLQHDALLVNASGKPILAQGIARMITASAKAAKIDVRVTPHMIRHTVATLLLRCGADIRIVQEVLGHASIATTQRYTHVSKEQLLATLRTRHPSFHLSIEIGRVAA
jgi:site-specific recombinase XerD